MAGPRVVPIPPADPAAKLTREFVTPEGVDLRLQLASAGERAGAFLLDVVFITLALVVLLIGAGLSAGPFGINGGEVAMRGDAIAYDDLSNFAKKLKTSKRFHDIVIRRASQSAAGTVQWEINCKADYSS